MFPLKNKSTPREKESKSAMEKLWKCGKWKLGKQNTKNADKKSNNLILGIEEEEKEKKERRCAPAMFYAKQNFMCNKGF